MFSNIDRGDGQALLVSTEVISIVEESAGNPADLLAGELRSLHISPEMASKLPEPLLLELSALAQLRDWEGKWNDDYPTQLPTSSDARAQIIQRLNDDPAVYGRIESATLSQLVLKFQLSELAWSTPEQLPTRFTLASDDSFLDQLAQVLWDTRNEL